MKDKTKIIFHLPAPQKKMLKQIAKRKKTNMSELIRLALKEAFIREL